MLPTFVRYAIFIGCAALVAAHGADAASQYFQIVARAMN